jgi:cytoskeletal protein CcmA (bactofilin family)
MLVLHSDCFTFASKHINFLYIMGKINEDLSGGLHNVLATGTVLTGTIVAESDFRLDGRIEGEINCKGKIVIGPKGSVKGNILTENAEIFGNIEGSIRARERLVLKSTAIIKGDIFIQTLEIEPGAKLNGTCAMAGKEGTPPPPPPNVQRPK